MSAAARAGRRLPHLPVAVAAGLAVGVVSGLLVLRSGGGARAASGAETAAKAGTEEVARAAAADAGDPGGEAAADPAQTEAAADAAAPAEVADAGVPDAGPADEAVAADGEESGEDLEPRTARLQFVIRPPEARGVTITVDGERVEGRAHTVEVSGARRRVRVAVRARGYMTWSRAVTVGRDRDVRVRLERPEASDDGPGGLIDL